MENHPIPQDVTGFKFKLIGSLTIKQFLYVLGGGIMAAICFILPTSGIIKIPLAALFGILGTSIAFVPIDGRPMDVMLKNFLKALPSENQYIFKKRGAEALIAEFFTPQTAVVVKAEQVKTDEDKAQDTKRALLYKTLRKSYRPDEKEQAVLTNINSYLHESSHSASPSVQRVDAAPVPLPHETPPSLQIVTPSVTIATKEVNQIQQPTQVAALPTTTQATAQTPDPQVLISVAQNINSLDVNAKNKLATPTPSALADSTGSPVVETIFPKPAPQIQSTEKIQHVDQALAVNPLSTTAIPLTTTLPTNTTAATPNQPVNVTSVTPETSLKAGFPQLPDTPNIVLGIIKDPRGKVLPNILVEIMNEQGVPVRAFKTNALGQFAAATPLPNGEYNVVLEDPRAQNEFGQFHIVLDGKIFYPLEIVSVDQREKLRRELFGATSTGAQVAA